MKKILVVDDEREQTEILAAYIEDTNVFECKTCYSGKSALEIIDKEYFDCIFLDLVMPEIGGIQVLKEIQKKNLKTKVVVISGFLTDALTEQCRKYGAYLILSKPAERERIMMILKRIHALQYTA